jgi:hypothetical protein
MRVLRQIQFPLGILFLIAAFAFDAKASKPPLLVKIANAPQFLVAGQSHVFTLEVQNTSDKVFTFSLLPGFRPSVSWRTKSGAGGGTGISGHSMTCMISTGFNPETGELVCKTLCYQPSDFVTLQPQETRQIDVTVDAPEDIQARRATATVTFLLESDFDGKDLDLTAWTGTFEFDYELPILKKKARGK